LPAAQPAAIGEGLGFPNLMLKSGPITLLFVWESALRRLRGQTVGGFDDEPALAIGADRNKAPRSAPATVPIAMVDDKRPYPERLCGRRRRPWLR
jgi:hypothetical protein